MARTIGIRTPTEVDTTGADCATTILAGRTDRRVAVFHWLTVPEGETDYKRLWCGHHHRSRRAATACAEQTGIPVVTNDELERLRSRSASGR